MGRNVVRFPSVRDVFVACIVNPRNRRTLISTVYYRSLLISAAYHRLPLTPTDMARSPLRLLMPADATDDWGDGVTDPGGVSVSWVACCYARMRLH